MCNKLDGLDPTKKSSPTKAFYGANKKEKGKQGTW